MDTSMTPSKTMTEPQIERAVEIFRAQLRKHAAELSSDAVQIVFGQPELGAEWLAVLRKRVEAQSNLLIRHVKVDRTRTPQQVLDATDRRQYTDKSVVKSMPHGEGEAADIIFFKVGRYVTDEELEKEYELRGLVAVDPFTLAALNTEDPAFADDHPNGTHWQDSDGHWCFAAFDRGGSGRRVRVNRCDYGWPGRRFFAGVRK